LGNVEWRLPGRHLDWDQRAQVELEWTGSPDRNYNDGSRWDPTQGSPREFVWTDEAACAGEDPELFQVSQQGDPDAGNRRGPALTKFNLAKYQQARVICEGCPIRAACLENSQPSDRYWSVRGGELPGKLKAERGKGVPGFDMSDWAEPRSCKIHGPAHMYVYDRKGGGKQIYCGACRQS